MHTFKRASFEDIETIRELAESSWKSAYQNILSPEQIDYMLAEMYSVKEIETQLKNPNYHYYLIEDAGKKVGFIGFENQYLPIKTKLHRLYLVAAAKGKGLGKSALDFLKSQVKNSSDNAIILNVNKQNPAKQFYESQNFNVIKEVINDIGNGFVMDDYVMEYKISR